MEGTTYGYVRVSTQEQNEARQLAAMREFGVPEQNIIVEKLSGKDFNRPRYLGADSYGLCHELSICYHLWSVAVRFTNESLSCKMKKRRFLARNRQRTAQKLRFIWLI